MTIAEVIRATADLICDLSELTAGALCAQGGPSHVRLAPGAAPLRREGQPQVPPVGLQVIVFSRFFSTFPPVFPRFFPTVSPFFDSNAREILKHAHAYKSKGLFGFELGNELAAGGGTVSGDRTPGAYPDRCRAWTLLCLCHLLLWPFLSVSVQL